MSQDSFVVASTSRMSPLSLWKPLVLAVTLVGCSTAADHFHTLRPPAVTAHISSQKGLTVLGVGPVTVPESSSRIEWVLRTGVTGVTVYSHQLWTQSLNADIAQTLSDYLNRGPAPVSLWATAGENAEDSLPDFSASPSLRVRIQVLRFDSALSPSPIVNDEVRWVLECIPTHPTISQSAAGQYHIVRTAVMATSSSAASSSLLAIVDEGQARFDQLAVAHSEGLRAVAREIDIALRESAPERARDCVSGSPKND